MKAKPIGAGGTVLPTREGYDRWAEVYETDGNPLTAMEEPVVRRLLGDVAGQRLLDLGCGTGRHAFAHAAEGAEVVALDFSAGMLEVARGKPGADAIRFLEHDLAEPLPFDDGHFDRVISCLVLEHLEDLPRLFGEVRRVMKPDGLAVITAMHPAMMLLGVQAGFRDPHTGDKLHPESHDNQISDFVMAALGAGLTFTALEEHEVTPELAADWPRADKYLGWMMLLAMRLEAIA